MHKRVTCRVVNFVHGLAKKKRGVTHKKNFNGRKGLATAVELKHIANSGLATNSCTPVICRCLIAQIIYIHTLPSHI